MWGAGTIVNSLGPGQGLTEPGKPRLVPAPLCLLSPIKLTIQRVHTDCFGRRSRQFQLQIITSTIHSVDNASSSGPLQLVVPDFGSVFHGLRSQILVYLGPCKRARLKDLHVIIHSCKRPTRHHSRHSLIARSGCCELDLAQHILCGTESSAAYPPSLRAFTSLARNSLQQG
jgi:hypothetical protein